ncbi:hypothetical protein DNC80_03770 [Flavobacterium sp. SOK18b]|nr:hypothetical protein [Flavobacterium sp. SOK18b]
MFKVLCLLIVLMTTQMESQEMSRIALKGSVMVQDDVLEGVDVVNKKTKETTRTNAQGNFSILAAVGDTLVFTGLQIKDIYFPISAQQFLQGFISVQANLRSYQLKEVVVQNGINARALGIIPKGQKTYTPAERKLYTATDLNASFNAGSMAGGSVSVDPLLNWISGRTKMLKKELNAEKNQFYILQIENLFTPEYFVTKLKIPVLYVKGFEYYCIENDSFIAALKSKNVALAAFLMGDLALKYKEIIAREN